jgi:hypothetical protein
LDCPPSVLPPGLALLLGLAPGLLLVAVPYGV